MLGCVLGFRGAAHFSEEHEIDGIRTVRLELPSTPIRMHGCASCPAVLRYDGRWLSTGGTQRDADANARVPHLALERGDGLAVLRAVIPLSVSGEVELELADLALPGDLDLEVRTRVGDVAIDGVLGYVVVEIETGQVTIDGATGLEVVTQFGAIEVASPGPVELRTGEGEVRLRQTGEPEDAVIVTGLGDIAVELADDADLDLQITTRGSIHVDTPRIRTTTSDRFERRTGDGSVVVRLQSARGRVEVMLVEP